MTKRWLNLFFRFSSLFFKIKQKIVEAKNWYIALMYALLLAVTEILFAIISLPLYFIVSPDKLYEQGFVFPSKEGPEKKLSTYVVKRRISLVTLGAAAGIYLVKVLLVGVISLYLLGAPMLFAAVQNWSFDVAGDYTPSNANIEITGGVAQLKDLGGSASGSTTNSGFNSDATGWTFATWSQPAQTTVSDGYVASGGNPGGYSQVRLQTTSNKNKTVSGYWYQGFTTTVNSPDTATLNLDWSSLTFTAATPPVSYKVYAFIDTASTAPTLGQEVWSSSEITGTTSWASIAPVSITAKVPTAGTYYLKFAARVQTSSTNTVHDLISGFDNVIVNWSKVSHSYDSTSPSIYPNTSLTSQKILSWNSFSETATKNGGEIYYQLSSDDGATWQYWNSGWTTAGASNYNAASVINTNIGTFTKATNKIRWKAFLTSNGTQQVILDNVAIDYTENILPSITGLTPSQGISTGKVYVNYNLVDTESDPSSLTAYEYSLNGTTWATMTAATADPLHNGVAGLTSSPAGVAHAFVWDAQADVGNIYSSTAQVRLTPNDGVANGTTATSTAFTIDYVLPVVTNVIASQTLGGTAVTISYDLSDDTTTDLLVDLEISGDGGLTWTVPTTTATGAVGASVTAGVGKTITWQAGTDYASHEQSNIQVHVRAKDKFQNQGTYIASSNFSLDTLAPATNVPANLLAQPNAGDTAVLIGGSFTESNPNTNDFYVEISDGGYGSSTSGTSDTASPSNQSTATAITLNGNSYISKVKITHTDDYGQAADNENTSPSTTYKYVKPYTPDAPTLSSPITNNLNLTVNTGSEAGGLEYLISETTQSKYVQADGTLGAGEVWRTIGGSTINVNGLSSPVSQYIFKVKSRNPNDSSHAASSESAFSATSQIANTAPAISFGSVSQTTDGSNYVNVNYTATDGQGDISSIPTFQYSTNGSDWTTMTEKSGVGSNGTTNLVFLPTGSNYLFAWDANANLPTFESNTVSVRLKPNDSLVDGDVATSSEFAVDTKVPVISSVSASQGLGGKTVSIGYNLTDGNNSTVTLEISSDGGTSWAVPITSATGDIGVVSPGNGKTITWNAGVDFNDQYNTTMLLRLRATDTKGNIGAYAPSSTFTVDTHAPVVSNVTAIQDSGAKTFTFHYDVSEDLGNVDVVLAISGDGGSTWTVPITSASGATGSGIAPGAGKTITWNGSTDFNDQEKTNMQIRITATDQYTNVGNNTSSNFSLDTQAPRITSVGGVETIGTTTVVFTYNLADQNNSTVQFDISSDAGLTWTVPKTAATGDFGAGITPGNGKTISWDAKTNFPNNDLATMQVRVRSTDIFTNAADNVPSANFSLDTIDPATNVTADLQAQPNAGDSTVLIGGSFTETNPNTNDFYTAVSIGDYGASVSGTVNTASPANQSTSTGLALNGSNYISKVKIVHTDDYGQVYSNENTSPNITYKYVKPYTPLAPVVDNPTVGTVDVTINKNASEVDGLEYAIFETSQAKYVQANGTLGASAFWGHTPGLAGKVTVNGLATHSYLYEFKVKSRNISDSLHAASSESDLSSGASSANQSPTIQFNSLSQTTDGSKYVDINYRGIDLESEISTLVYYKYSTDDITYNTMTEKGGVGSEGVAGLAFSHSTGTTHHFMWDVGTDLANSESSTVYVRLQANDGTSTGGQSTSSTFTIDTKNPIISAVTATQTAATNTVAISYTLGDISNSNVELQISGDGGSTWTVPTTTATGSLGAGITPGSGKSVSWNAGVDFLNQEISNLQVQLRATDSYGNAGSFAASANSAVDTKSPVVTNVSASQSAGSSNVNITYDLADANNSTVYFDVSNDNGATWTVVTGIVNDVVPGNGKTIGWVAATDFPNQENTTMKVQVRATDAYANAGTYFPSSTFTVDTRPPTISTVTASQILGSQNVTISYNLSDNGAVNIAAEISSDDGSTWTVPTSTLTGAIGAGQTTGTGKIISWNAGTDFSGQDNSIMKVRITGTDGFDNSSTVSSSIFNLDTLAPATSIASDLLSQPNAGDTAVLIGGSFTETNPNTNDFYVAINAGAYGTATAGTGNTATPANQSTIAGASLTGSDYISKVKIVETDKYSRETSNENTSPANKYVKPYTPSAPTINNPQNTSVDVTINPHASESATVEYLIYEVGSGKYVQTNGTLNTTEVWKTLGTGAGQWGLSSSISGKITVTGLVSPVAQYSFRIKSRNPSDAAHLPSSESNLSTVSAISNTAPTIAITSAAQQGSNNYVLINYTGIDVQNDTVNLTSFEYSTNNVLWNTMTERSGVGSNGTSALLFTTAGASYIFAWDLATDLPNAENATVYVRLAANDTLATGSVATSSAFPTDTRGPVISNVSTSQTIGSNNFNIYYDAADISGSNINVILQISSDGGSTWTVPTTTATGDVGASVTSGVNKSIAWNAGVDFPNHEQSNMQMRLRGTDSYNNAGDYAATANFTIDTKAPVVSAATASQTSGSGNVLINYTITDATVGGNFVELEISDDDGLTWAVTPTITSGDIGAGVNTGALSITWNAATDFISQYQSDIKVRIKARDYFGNQGGFTPSSAFAIDTVSPIVSAVSAAQTLGTGNVVITYTLADDSPSNMTVDLNVSPDGGLSWNTTATTLTGDVGANQTAGNKTVSWDAATDFGNEDISNVRVRINATDGFANTNTPVSSGDFAVDTKTPQNLVSLSKFSETSDTVTLNWSTPIVETNFNHYEIWHGSSQDDVNARTGTATVWNVANDATLNNLLTSSTVVTGISITSNYYAKVWAVDNYGNEATAANINLYTPPVTPEVIAQIVVSSGGGGGGVLPVHTLRQMVLPKPVLDALPNTINQTRLLVSGLASPGTRVDVYDNGTLIGRVADPADENGRFHQLFIFTEGTHRITARAINTRNNSSEFSDPIQFKVLLIAPPAPIIISPDNNADITSDALLLTGTANPFSTVEITLDDGTTFTSQTDANGDWLFNLPSSLELGPHNFTVREIDLAENVSPTTTLLVNKLETVPELAPSPGLLPIEILPVSRLVVPTGTEAAPIIVPTEPAPIELINSVESAITLPGLIPPKIVSAQVPITIGANIMSFGGIAEPNQNVVVYIHSDQAIIYNTKADSKGIWTVNHSQNNIELTPGVHTIYSVGLDQNARVKSLPSTISQFTVTKNFWAVLYSYLNLYTTSFAIAVILLAMFWLYRIRSKL